MGQTYIVEKPIVENLFGVDIEDRNHTTIIHIDDDGNVTLIDGGPRDC